MFENYYPENGREKKKRTGCKIDLQCLVDYNNPSTFIYINQLFDYLPLAAIVSGKNHSITLRKIIKIMEEKKKIN